MQTNPEPLPEAKLVELDDACLGLDEKPLCDNEPTSFPIDAGELRELLRGYRAQAAFAEREARNRRTLQDHGRMLWRDDVEGHCPTPNLCFQYNETARCGPCAIKQSNAAGVEVLYPDNSYSPEVCRLKREVAQQAEREARLVGALEGLIDDEPCWYDHHGYCQTHYVTSPCEMAKARATLAALKDRTHD